jgi:hypothetical protein
MIGAFWSAIDQAQFTGHRPTIDGYWRWLALELKLADAAAVATALEGRKRVNFQRLVVLMGEADVARFFQ